MDHRKLILVLLLMLLSGHTVLCQWIRTMYVSTNGKDVPDCWSGKVPCGTLEYTVSGVSNSSTRIVMLDGQHSLGILVTLANFTKIAITGAGMNSSWIECTSKNHTGAGMHFIGIRDLYLANLTLVNCGGLGYSTVENGSSPNTTILFRSVVYVVNCTDVQVHSVNFINGTGIGLSIFDTNGTVSVIDSVFTGNRVRLRKGELYVGGGGLYIEHTYCTPGRTSDCDYQNNPFVKNCRYIVRGCFFAYNEAVFLEPYPFIREKAEVTYSLGRGAGINVNLKGNSFNNTITMSNCTFLNNSAPFGGGVNIELYDSASNNSVMTTWCVFERNAATENGGGGGAFRVGIEFYTCDCIVRNNFTVLHTKFANNTAQSGGAVEFFSSRTRDAGQVTNLIRFVNCTWIENSALIGPAVELAPEAWSTLTDGYLPTPVFEHCEFLSNRLIDHENQDQVSLSGIVFLNTYTVNLTTIAFRGNKGSALFVTAGSVNVLKGTVIFDANEAIQGGAVALMGFSAIRTFPNSTLIFVNNRATDVGGAIFASSVDVTDFVYSRDCFIRYCIDTVLPNQWKTYFYFHNNSAESYGHSIYATSLYPCARASVNGSWTSTINLKHLFRWPWAPFNYTNPNKPYNIASDPSQIVLNVTDPSDVRFAPGQVFDLKPVAKDDMNNTVDTVYKAITYTSRGDHAVLIDNSYTSGKLSITGQVNSTFKLTLRTTGFRKIEVSANITLTACPPGFVIQGSSSQAQCVCSASTNETYAGISQCNNFTALLTKGYWAGCTDSEEDSLATSQCPLGYCRDIYTDETTVPLGRNCSSLDAFLCGDKKRTGTLCGRCKDNLTVYYHSQRYLCSECKYGYIGWLFYILSELLPLTILFVVIMAFDISLTSGIANSFILYAQVLNFFQVNSLGNFTLPLGVTVLTDIYQFLFGFLNLDFFSLDQLSFCLWDGATVLDVLVFKYVTTAYALLLLISLLIAFRFFSRLSCAQRMLKGSSVLHGLSAFVILSYAQCAKVSFQILTRTQLRGKGVRPGKDVVFLSGTTEFLSIDHLPYAIPAIFVLLTVCVMPPFLLLVYPAINHLRLFIKADDPESIRYRITCGWFSFSRMKPLFDSFQGCFKDNLRFFAGLYFVYRLAISAAFAFSDNGIAFYVSLEVVVVCILAIHAAAQPYKKRIYNIIDSLVFADLALVTGLSLYNFYWSQYQSTHGTHVITAASVQVVLIYIPVLYAVVILVLKVASKFRRIRFKLRRVNQYLPLFDAEVEEYTELQTEEPFDEDHFPARLFEPDETPSGSRRQRRRNRGDYGATNKYTTY